MESTIEPGSADHREEFRAWTDPEAELHPAAELLAEHHLMAAVLTAMERMAVELRAGGQLDLAYLADVVDFIGNFVHHCHRAKEEKHFFPRVVLAGLIDPDGAAQLEREHDHAGDMTLELIRLAEAGDWEGVLRVVLFYVRQMRPHMRREERHLMQPSLRALQPGVAADLRQAFAVTEKRALGSRTRKDVLELARKLCARVGLADLLQP